MSVKIREALEPVIDWYQSDEHPSRDTVDIVEDIVADLQMDRNDSLKCRKALREIRQEAERCYSFQGGRIDRSTGVSGYSLIYGIAEYALTQKETKP